MLRTTTLFASALSLAAAACALDVEPDDIGDNRGDGPAISWEEFRDSAELEPFADGVFIVDGDIPLAGEDALRAYYDEYALRSEGALTVMTEMGADVIWGDGDRFALTYCVSDDFGADRDEVVREMAEAADSWSRLAGVGYQFVDVADCDQNAGEVVFDVSPPPTSVSYFARAFFPNEGRAARRVLINDSAFTTTAGGRDLQGILRHELGHTLGFRHEHIWLPGGCTGEGSDDARQVTEYDEDSVMHYPQCRDPQGGGYRQTDLDYRGAISLYGLSPRLIVAVM